MCAAFDLRSVWSNGLETTGETRASVRLMANLRSADEKSVREAHESSHFFFIDFEILHSNPVILLFFPFPNSSSWKPAFQNSLLHSFLPLTLSASRCFFPFLSPLPFHTSITAFLSPFSLFPSLFPRFGFVKGGFISGPEWCRSTGSTDNGPIIRGKQSPWKRNKDPLPKRGPTLHLTPPQQQPPLALQAVCVCVCMHVCACMCVCARQGMKTCVFLPV